MGAGFEVVGSDGRGGARAGVLRTAHGAVETPAFMPVATQGAVKAVHLAELTEDIGASIVLANGYHLYLRPGVEVLERAGGLHAFSGWRGALLTDSGGYQVFSLSDRRKLREEGVEFRSHIDGSLHCFTPEKAVDVQRSIGADIMMALDECCPGDADYAYAERSLGLTERWLERCIARFGQTEGKYGYEQRLFPVVQGGVYAELRRRAAEYVAGKGAAGNAIGGLSVGEPTEVMYAMIEEVNAILPRDKPRYLMGVGTPVNLLECIARGVDMFDCIIPTRNGRNGQLFTKDGVINIKNREWADNFTALEADGASRVDRLYSKAYVHHLFKSSELLGLQIASVHNLAFYLWLTAEARRRIIAGDFAAWKTRMIKQLSNRL